MVRPLLKKPQLDPSILSNFRPVSHLPFLYKVLEKVVFKQLQSFLEDNDVFDQFHLTVAFDTVEHTVLLSHLNQICCWHQRHRWCQHIIANSLSVMIGVLSSSRASFCCGGPQNSISAPTLFSLYMLPLGSFIVKHILSFHCHADDIKIYLPVQPTKSRLQLVQNAGACFFIKNSQTWVHHSCPLCSALASSPVKNCF